ncbi:MAG: sulfatase [Planctomycetes bacterium]|nr:sulfatase [Planctomycetota bacterium]
MTRIFHLVSAFLAIILPTLLPSVAAGQGKKTKRPPNVIIIYADDMGYADCGCFGAKKIKTPHLDRMAKRGVRFTSFYVAQAVCSASRAALMTGKYSNRAGVLGALGPAAKGGLARHHFTIAEMLKALGYATSMIGKWHLGHSEGFLPTQRGFDEYYGLPYSNDMWPKHPTAKFPDLPLISGTKKITLNPDQSALTTDYTDRAVKFIKKNKNQPFFLYLAHTMPHVPLFVSARQKGKSAGGLYGDVIEELDWSVGQIMAALKANGLEEDTLVIFTSDNGPWLSYGNHGGSAGLLREGKGTAWEGGVRVPFIASWPGHLPADKTQKEPAMTIDLLPTIARITGAKLPAGKLDGKDIRPLLFCEPNAKSPHDAYFFYWGKELHGVRAGPWKLYFPRTYRTMAGQKPGKDGRPGLYKNVKAGLELFNLDDDLGERANIAARNPDVVRRLETLAERMRADLGDTLKKK